MSTSPTFTLRPSAERGRADHGWLQARFSFSFGDYYDPRHMSYRSLRVINQDRIQPGGGFGMHPHAEMEIFTYLVRGELRHEDSMGNARTLRAGEFQYMSAGSGVRHSEVNPCDTETELLQIWITPNQQGGAPKYAELDTTALPGGSEHSGLTLFASADGRDGSVQMRQDAEISIGRANADGPSEQPLSVPSSAYEGAWLQLISGQLTVENHDLQPGDGLRVDHAAEGFPLTASPDALFLLFRLA